ncbi:YihY/virulence factor BrkB family protein [Patescibacteria group bacterium]|nr:YihY/virulence factor BrkB family protein [Patescibacteria group bacterium]
MAILPLLKQAGLAWKRDHASYLAAAISYHAIFSLAPLFIIVLAITGAIYGQESTQQQFVSVLRDFIGQDSALLIQQLLEKADLGSRSGSALLIGGVLTVIGSIGVFKQLQEAVSIIWKAPIKQRTLLHQASRYLLLFLLVLLASGLLIASLVISAIISEGGRTLSAWVGVEAPFVLSAANSLTSLALITTLFAILFRTLPDVGKLDWQKIWPAALVTALLFNVGKFLIGLYIGHSTISSVYGAAGSLIALLVWIFYAAQIFLYGIELVKVQHLKPSSL